MSKALLSCMAVVNFLVTVPGAQRGPAQVPSGSASGPCRAVTLVQQCCSTSEATACEAAVLLSIDAAREREGVRPLTLPSYYSTLTPPQQLLVLADRERRDRGLPGFTGLSSDLGRRAMAGARADRDPEGPKGSTWGSNWAGGQASALLAHFDWVYDDGVGSANVECRTDRTAGCWAHRANVLGRYGPHPSMGAAFTSVHGRTSYAEVFSSAPPRGVVFRLPGRR